MIGLNELPAHIGKIEQIDKNKEEEKMGIMDKMMDRMIINMSVEEKEEMMLKMMPTMMEDIDINKMMPDTMTAMGRLITITGIVVFISKASNDDELKEELGELLNNLREKMPELQEMMRDMMPIMMSLMSVTGLMDGMMNMMGKMMPVMMPMMREMMPIMMKEKMPELMAKHENVREMCPEMMMDVIPDCIDTMLPIVAQEKRAAFLSRLAEKMGRVAIGEKVSAEDKENLEEELVGKIKSGFGVEPS